MALKRLTRGAIVCCVLLALSAWAQNDPSEMTPNQDGVMLLDGLGSVYGKGEDGSAANEFPDVKFEFGIIIGEDMELIKDPLGEVVGGYVLDSLGGQFPFGEAKSLADLDDLGNAPPFFGWDILRDMEITPDWRTATYDYQGYLLLDGFGGVHPVGRVNLPQYPLGSNGEMVDTPYPESMITTEDLGDPADLFRGGPINETSIARPIFTYFGWDIARDLEVSTQYVTISTSLVVSPGFNPASAPAPSFASVSSTPGGKVIAMCNGYYILDGLGAVHSCRLPLNFDVNDDGVVDDADVASPEFGKPANNRPLVIPWVGSDQPYFGWDIAREIELTPTGNGYYLLDGFGAIHTVGDAHTAFPNPFTPYFGFDIARGMTVVPGINGDTAVGYLVVDAFGIVHKAGFAEDYDISNTGNDGKPITSFADSFRDIEITPKYLGVTVPRTVYNPGYAVSVAPSGTDLADPIQVYNLIHPDEAGADLLQHKVVPYFEVSTAPYPFFDYATGVAGG